MPLWTPEIDLSLPDALAILARDQPDIDPSGAEILGEGWDNLAVLVSGWVFRFSRRELAARLMHNELTWLPLLAAPLEVPVSVAKRRGILSRERPWPYMGHPLLRGTTADRVERDPAALAGPLGRFIGALHAASVPSDAPTDSLGRGDHVRRGRRAIERLAAIDASRLESDRARIEALMEAPPYRGPPRWVHGDLYGRHVLLDEQKHLCGVIDWGDLHAGDPAVDLSILYSLFPPQDRYQLLNAYAERVGMPPDRAMLDRARAIAYDYAGALIPYGKDVSDPAAVALGELAWANASAD